MKLISLTITVMAALFVGQARAAQKVTIYTEHFPPYNFIYQGEVVGINVDIVKASCIQAELECEFKSLPWKRAYTLTQTDQFSGLISTSRNEKREKQFQWIGPLVSSTTRFYRLSNRTDIKARSLAEITQYSIGIPRDDVYHDFLVTIGFEPGINLLETSKKDDDLKLFFDRKLDMFIGSELTLPYQLAAVGQNVSAVKPVMYIPLDIMQRQGNYLALNSNFPAELAERLQRGVDTLRNEDDFEAIIEKYRKQSPQPH